MNILRHEGTLSISDRVVAVSLKVEGALGTTRWSAITL